MTQTTKVHVCVCCKKMSEVPLAPCDPNMRDGQVLFEKLKDEFTQDDGIEIEPVECLSSCNFGCNIALTGAHKWNYVYGKLNPETDIEEIAQGIRAYAQTEDGIVPWRERPVIFRKNSISRIPPQISQMETKS